MATNEELSNLALDCVQALHPYQPGKPVEELERELGISEIVKFTCISKRVYMSLFSA